MKTAECKSPIEQALFDAYVKLIEVDHWSDDCDYRVYDCANHLGSVDEMVSEYNSDPHVQPFKKFFKSRLDIIFVQPRIGGIRPDLMVGRYDWALVSSSETSPSGELNDPVEVLLRSPLISIECDGHEFHERTKEQAKRDKSRDRLITSLDIRPIRFTGSEIYRDADKCAKEVDSLIRTLMGPYKTL